MRHFGLATGLPKAPSGVRRTSAYSHESNSFWPHAPKIMDLPKMKGKKRAKKRNKKRKSGGKRRNKETREIARTEKKLAGGFWGALEEDAFGNRQYHEDVGILN